MENAVGSATEHAGVETGPELVALHRGDVEQRRTVERIVRWQARHYRDTLGFDASFASGTRADMAALLRDFDPGVDGWWLARVVGEPIGSITVDGRGKAAGEALLRWFILAPAARGRGLGRLLLGRALDFCRDAGYRRVRLITSPRFEAAVHLYRGAGFERVRVETMRLWEARVEAHTYELELAALPPSGQGAGRLVRAPGS